MKSALASEQRKLEDQEERLIELVADGAVATLNLREKLNQIALQKGAVAEKLERTLASLDAGVKRAHAQLDLPQDPAHLYRMSPGNVRRDVLCGLFRKLTI
ncbi:hypothetical protein AB6V29_06020 [Microbacterium sp. 20-116]|uniref:hypothetical protein n=1 Tax=Microbacterium TaxID=33882 RepID=UPI00226F3B02|nr:MULTISPECIES: hypothetical protein [Microbacterium]WAC69399.1 hypothetical protein OVA17_01510 [Microbacterium sp. SL75]WJS90046.1 hypothetical protein NYQ11_12040 [Microbacterium testaceum]